MDRFLEYLPEYFGPWGLVTGGLLLFSVWLYRRLQKSEKQTRAVQAKLYDCEARHVQHLKDQVLELKAMIQTMNA